MSRIFLTLTLLGTLVALLLPLMELSSRRSGQGLELWTASLKPYFQDYVEGVLRRWGHHVRWVDLPLSVVPQRLIASELASDVPDLVNLDLNWTYSLYWKGLLQPVPLERCPNSYLPQTLNALKIGDRYIGVPWYINVKVMLCNSEALEELGASPPESLDDLIRLASLSREDLWGYWPYLKFEQDLQAYGGRFELSEGSVSYYRPAIADLLKSLRRLYLQGKYPRSAIDGNYAEAIALFLTGKVGCIVMGPQFIARVRREAPKVYEHLVVRELPFERPPITMMTLVVPEGGDLRALDLACHVTSTPNQLELSELAPVLPSTVDGLRMILSECRGQEQTPEDQARCLTAEQALRGELYELKLPSIRWRSALYRKALRDVIVRGEAPRHVLRELSREVSSEPEISTALKVLGR